MPLDGADELDPEEAVSTRPSTLLRRDADLLGRKDSACRKWLRKKIDAIVRGFEEQADRSDELDKWWRIYNCKLDDNQFYNGNAEVYVPIIHDAIDARATRFANQLCPENGRLISVTSTDGHVPYENMALINHYLRGFKTGVLYPLLVCGDIEGQYNLYVDWEEVDRHLVSRETRGPELDGMALPQGVGPPETEIVDIIEEEVTEGCPAFEVLHDADVLVLPATADTIPSAFARGGSVTIVRRWSKDKYLSMVEAGEVEGVSRDDGGEVLTMSEDTLTGLQNLPKKLARMIGIRAPTRHVIMFETWLLVPLADNGGFSEKGKRRLCRFWWNLLREPEGLKRNPYWNDRCPLLSWPVKKRAGVFKGQSLVEPLAPLQYEANDAANERADVDHKSAMPIIRDGREADNSPLVLADSAVWKGAPNSLEFLQFPDLSQRGRARIMDAMQLIFQSLGINPAMLPQQTGRQGQRRNQAEVALEQSVDLLTVAEAVEAPTEHILTPAVGWIVDLDYQFRDRELTIRAFGEMGLPGRMVSVPPLQNRAHYHFEWCGAQQVKQTVAMMQQGTAAINMVRGLAQEIRAEGYQLRLGPVLERLFSNIFGGELGAQTLIDMRHQQGVDPELENRLLLEGHLVPVHPLDNVQEHLIAHQQAKAMDPHGTVAIHIQAHLMQAAAQNAAMMAQMAGGGSPGVPGGAGPGVSGRPPGAPPPQPGAAPQPPRQMKGPPGMIAPESLPRAGAVVMPRKM